MDTEMKIRTPTPMDVFKATEVNLEPLFETIVKKLYEGYKVGGSVWVSILPLGRYERNIVSQRLEEAGWKCVFHSDQRDGDSIQISAIEELDFFKENTQ